MVIIWKDIDTIYKAFRSVSKDPKWGIVFKTILLVDLWIMVIFAQFLR